MKQHDGPKDKILSIFTGPWRVEVFRRKIGPIILSSVIIFVLPSLFTNVYTSGGDVWQNNSELQNMWRNVAQLILSQSLGFSTRLPYSGPDRPILYTSRPIEVQIRPFDR